MTPPSHAATADDVGVPEPARTEATASEPGEADARQPEEPLDDARLMHHAYDGIREYDNPLPGWWSAIFIGSIVFAGFYGLYFHVVDWGRTPEQAYQVALGEYEGKRELRERAEAANVSEQSLARGATDSKQLERGAEIFKTRCASCHADEGQGLIGPNLTDLVQLHGTTRMDLYTTVSKGVPGTAMLAWGDQMAQPDVVAVAAFVVTLRGKNVPGKAPQGTPVEKFQ